MSTTSKTTVLCILDGWGYAPAGPANAISRAKTPTYDHLLKTCPWSLLETSGEAVGLPAGQMGNSEVGHLTIGGGRIPIQDLPKLNRAFADGSFKANSKLLKILEDLRSTGSHLHLMGLFSDGGVHAHIDHLLSILRYAVDQGVTVIVHPFLDGRDTLPQSASSFIESFVAHAPKMGWCFGTVMGRYYAMDRDQRWERTHLAYDALVYGKGPSINRIEDRHQDSSDEFVSPQIIQGYQGFEKGDAVLLTNFRVDRMRQLVASLVLPTFTAFDRGNPIVLSSVLGMVTYDDEWHPYIHSLFSKEKMVETLGEVISKAGLRQLRLAETEKYAHVTYFFNGGSEDVFAGEERLLIPSPTVATYDVMPEMSADQITDKLVGALRSGNYALIVVNFANADMVGHSGNEDATIAAIECIDGCLGRIVDTVKTTQGQMLVTADHGNAEMLVDPKTQGIHTAHTTNPVPCILVHAASSGTLNPGSLRDVAPTLLDLMGLKKPEVMTGSSLWRSA